MTCPMNVTECKGKRCAWFCAEDEKCAIALLPSVLDWIVRFALTKPYPKEEDTK